MKEAYRFRASDFIPLFGTDNYKHRNGIPDCDLRYTLCDRRELNRLMFLEIYEQVAGATLMLGAIAGSILALDGIERLLK